MNALLALPFSVQLALMFVGGTFIGSFVNLASYRLAFEPRSISPWSSAPPKATRRSWLDRIPVVGWFRLNREEKIHGTGFWIRPMLVELVLGLFCAWFYDHSFAQGTLPTFTSQMVLIAFMAAATLIDFDEQIIPDELTVPGTLIGLLFAAIYPWSLLPADSRVPPTDFLRLTSPLEWPAILDGWQGLLIGLLCWWAWCVALMPRFWRPRLGLSRALKLACLRAIRDPMGWIGAVGMPAIALVWWFVPGTHWAGLLTSLVGVAAGGAYFWSVRIVGSGPLQTEAMGFGDVTLMSMIGAYLGWQGCTLVFFFAPFAGLLFVLLRFIVNREKLIPYGPFLCLAALVLIVQWQPIWDYAEPIFGWAWLVPGLMLTCLVLLLLMLKIWVTIRDRLFPET